jgi:ubiquinone/menaquinone biosynthesis C-methylase UbiE
VSGLDAAEGLLALARERVPEADLRLGDLQTLPYDDDSFDLVTGFTSFFFADDIVAALRDAGRVARPGAPVAIQVFGRPELCDLEAMKGAVARFRPAADSGEAAQSY